MLHPYLRGRGNGFEACCPSCAANEGMGILLPTSIVPKPTITKTTASSVIKAAGAIVASGGTLTPVQQAAVRTAAAAPTPQTVIQVGVKQPIQVGTTTPAPTGVITASSGIRPTVAPTPMLPGPKPTASTIVITPSAGETIIKNAGAITAAGGQLTPAQTTVVKAAVTAVATGTSTPIVGIVPKQLPSTQGPPIMTTMPSPAQNEIIVSAVSVPTSAAVKAAGMISPPALTPPAPSKGVIQVGGGRVALPQQQQAETVSINNSLPLQLNTATGNAAAILNKPSEVASPVKKALVFGVPAALLLWTLL